MWPEFRPQDLVRVRRSGRIGHVNHIEPNETEDGWLFELLFDPRELATYDGDELELVEASGQEHDPEIEIVVETSSADPGKVAHDLARVATETVVVQSDSYRVTIGNGINSARRVRVGLHRGGHPREEVRALMERLGSNWRVEDDGWYANVTWSGDRFPVDEIDGAEIFLRPWRDPRAGERLPGESHE